MTFYHFFASSITFPFLLFIPLKPFLANSSTGNFSLKSNVVYAVPWADRKSKQVTPNILDWSGRKSILVLMKITEDHRWRRRWYNASNVEKFVATTTIICCKFQLLILYTTHKLYDYYYVKQNNNKLVHSSIVDVYIVHCSLTFLFHFRFFCQKTNIKVYVIHPLTKEKSMSVQKYIKVDTRNIN